MGMGLTYIYGLVLTQLSLPLYALKMELLQTYKEDFGLETVFNIWWRGNVIESLCRWKEIHEAFYHISPFFLQRFTTSLQYNNLLSSIQKTPWVQWIKGKGLSWSIKTSVFDSRAKNPINTKSCFPWMESKWILRSKR